MAFAVLRLQGFGRSAFMVAHCRDGSSKRAFLSFPAGVKDDMGNALGIAQVRFEEAVYVLHAFPEEVAVRHPDSQAGC